MQDATDLHGAVNNVEDTRAASNVEANHAVQETAGKTDPERVPPESIQVDPVPDQLQWPWDSLDFFFKVTYCDWICSLGDLILLVLQGKKSYIAPADQVVPTNNRLIFICTYAIMHSVHTCILKWIHITDVPDCEMSNCVCLFMQSIFLFGLCHIHHVHKYVYYILIRFFKTKYLYIHTQRISWAYVIWSPIRIIRNSHAWLIMVKWKWLLYLLLIMVSPI